MYLITYLKNGEYVAKEIEDDKLPEALNKLAKAKREGKITDFYYWRLK